MDSEHIVLSRLLPKTGQTIQYQNGDDGTYEKGWWKGRDASTNRERFIAKTIDGDDVVIDRATGLMWAARGDASGCVDDMGIDWSGAISFALGLTFAGFSGDWRVPNIKELQSIADYSEATPAIDPLFTNTYNMQYWSSTTYMPLTGRAFYTHFAFGEISYFTKSAEYALRCVRSL